MAEDTDTKKRRFNILDKTYAVRMPTVDEIKQANEARATAFNEALNRGDLLRDQLEGELRKRKLWNDDREREYQTLRQEVLDGEFQLQKGGIKLSRAKDVALQMATKRSEMVNLLSSRTDLDANTCEGKADAARFNYLFASCLVYDETDEPYYSNGLDGYLQNPDDAVAATGAVEFYYLISGTENIDTTLPENKFLHKFKFVNDNLELIDKDGRLVNADGHHIDELGNLIKWGKDGSSTKVDPSGRVVNPEGDFDVSHSAFLDESGKSIDESSYANKKQDSMTDGVVEKPKARRKTKKPVGSDT
tara:strand:- start:4936 stop:5847 length:912 start_codon:yes stop_codon:yes gene_type:complete